MIDPYDDLVDLFRLACLQSGGTGQFSSHDRSGGDQDYSWWTYLRAEPRRAVLADVGGPGCISRIWVTAFDPDRARIEIFVDGATTPVVSAHMRDFFGSLSPFIPPLAGPTSGGWVSYVPIPFQRNCRIEAYDAPQFNGQFYYDVTYRTYMPGEAISESFTIPPTGAQQARLNQFATQWANRGQDPKIPQIGALNASGTLGQVGAGQTVNLGNIAGAGIITGISLSVTPQSSDLLGNARLRCRWDGATTNAVDAPLGSFFASGFGPADAQGLPLGTKDGQLYCYFPMPYSSGAVIELWNGSATAIDSLKYAITYQPGANAPGLLRFHADTRSARPPVGVPYRLFDASGRGHLIGSCLSIHSLDNNWVVLEGDELIFIDGEKTPSIWGTGTEDYFNGGFYFASGPFSQPFSGCSLIDSSQRRVSAYRFCVSDPVVFHDQLVFDLQHGFSNNKAPADYSSTTYFYLDQNPGASLPPPVLPPVAEGALVNGDMQLGFGGFNNGEARGWLAYQSGTYFGYPPCEFAPDSAQVFSGSYSQKITLALPASGFQSAGIAQQVPVSRGIRYQVTARLRLSLNGDLHPGDVIGRLGIGLAGSTNFEDPEVIWADAPTATDTWLTVTAQATAERDYMAIFAGGLRKWPNVGGTAAVWVGGVSMTRVGGIPVTPPPDPTPPSNAPAKPPPAPASPAAPGGPGLPVIQNAGFESGSSPWTMWIGSGGNDDPLERDPDGVEGFWVLAVKGFGPGGKGAFQYVPSGWVPGRRYRLAVSVRNLANSGIDYSIGYTFGNPGTVGSSRAVWSTGVSGTSTWQQATIEFLYDGTLGATIYLRAANTGSSERAGFDNVSIVAL